MEPAPITAELEGENFAYITTTGRTTGRPHRIEIWFAVVDDLICVISGGRDRSDWVKNLIIEPQVRIEIGDLTWSAIATTVDQPDHPARAALAARYQGWRPGQPLTNWATTGLVVELSPVTGTPRSRPPAG